jgi:hypothetical protein
MTDAISRFTFFTFGEVSTNIRSRISSSEVKSMARRRTPSWVTSAATLASSGGGFFGQPAKTRVLSNSINSDFFFAHHAFASFGSAGMSNFAVGVKLSWIFSLSRG